MTNNTPIPCTVPAEEVARLKSLGFLRDKLTADCFNARIITRNGKITAEEARTLSEAAARFGSGEMAMTTRLTIELQRIPYDQVDALIDFLSAHGLQTGGTGAKVRPVVSCKGTTCQYGLIDTFALSEAIHQRFYEGFHDVKLPHKFKIAVGGCPNNCVKPELNDLGVIGARRPVIDPDKCKGCKVCQVVNACPIHVPVVTDGVVAIDSAACNDCGRCFGKVPLWRGESPRDRLPCVHRRPLGQAHGPRPAAGRHSHRRGAGHDRHRAGDLPVPRPGHRRGALCRHHRPSGL